MSWYLSHHGRWSLELRKSLFRIPSKKRPFDAAITTVRENKYPFITAEVVTQGIDISLSNNVHPHVDFTLPHDLRQKVVKFVIENLIDHLLYVRIYLGLIIGSPVILCIPRME